MPRELPTPDFCPVCGAPVPGGARACPGCGADERSGWNEDSTRYDDLNLPDEAFANDGEPARRRTFGGGKLWISMVAVMLVILFLSLVLL